MAGNKKLGRASDQRMAMLKSMVTSLFEKGKLETTEARAGEVMRIAEKLLTIAIGEADSFTSKQEMVSKARLSSKGKKITMSKTSKNDRKYDVVERETKTEMVVVDSPDRLHARRKMMRWLYRVKDSKGNYVNLTEKIFTEYAPKYKSRSGGYLRIYKLGPRRGDAAEMALLEFV